MSLKSSKVAFFQKKSWYHRKKEILEDGTVKYSTVGGFKTEEEAEKNYYECLKKFERQRNLRLISNIDKEVEFKDYLTSWYENIYSKKVNTTTAMLTSYIVYNLIIPNIQYDIKVRLVTSEYINELLDRIDKIGKTTANKSREVLKNFFNDVVENKIITTNPVELSKFYKRGKPQIQILSKSEIKELLKIASKDNWYLEILLGLFCGLRKGEIRGLKFQDFNKEEKTVKICRQVTNNYKMEKNTFKICEKEYIEANPKTENSFRIIKVPNIVFEELERRRDLIEGYKNKYKDMFADKDYVSCQINGNPRSESSFNTYLLRVCKRNGLPHITVHGLRHMFATILMEQGVSLAKISAILGHSSITTTFNYYCDVIQEKEKISAFVNNKFPVEQIEEEECEL